jgi:prevent-host-death family protein
MGAKMSSFDIPNEALLTSLNLKTGFVPISKAAASLSELIKRTSEQEPIVVTQNGYPKAVIIDIDAYTTIASLLELIKRTSEQEHVIVTQDGAPKVAIIDIDAYKTMLELTEQCFEAQDIVEGDNSSVSEMSVGGN